MIGFWFLAYFDIIINETLPIWTFIVYRGGSYGQLLSDKGIVI